MCLFVCYVSVERERECTREDGLLLKIKSDTLRDILRLLITYAFQLATEVLPVMIIGESASSIRLSYQQHA
jgi:hypothetical protein